MRIRDCANAFSWIHVRSLRLVRDRPGRSGGMAVCEVKTSHAWRIWAVAVLGLVGVISILATSRLQVPTGGPDTSPPTIHFGSAGLPSDLVMTDSSATSPTRRARSTD